MPSLVSSQPSTPALLRHHIAAIDVGLERCGLRQQQRYRASVLVG